MWYAPGLVLVLPSVHDLFADMKDVFEKQHSRPQRPCSFWSAQRIVTSRKVTFSVYAQRNRFVLTANQIVRLDSEHAQSDGKSANRKLPGV